jgi:hypothetical protein
VVPSRIDWRGGILAVGFLDEDRIIVGSHPGYPTSRSSTRCSGTTQPALPKTGTATEMHQVGGQTILEHWIPTEDLNELNANIVGLIHVVAEFR